MKKFLYLSAVLLSVFFSLNTAFSAVSAPAAPKTPSVQVQIKNTQSANLISPLAVIDNPNAFLNKTVSFTGEFVSFTSLGLDYKPAFKDSSKYIGILIRRPDIKSNTVPLSEFKMFLSREQAEKHIDIEAGDKVKISGMVFSAALGDPWLEISQFEVIEKINKDINKK